MKIRQRSKPMFPIFDFCQQKFNLVQSKNVTIGNLQEIAGQHGDDVFVLFDPVYRESACVIPEAVEWAVHKFQLAPNEIAAKTGIFKILRRNQAVVHRDQPAVRIAELASSEDVDAIVAVSDVAKPVGIFLPGIVAERLTKTRFVTDKLSSALQTQVRSLRGVGNLSQAIGALETQGLSFHSEKLNIYGGEPYVCDGGGAAGPHFRNSCPCRYHPGAGCRRRNIV
jgi:hypothetical protein